MELTGNDLVYTIAGAIGFVTVILVLQTSFKKINTQEVKRARARKKLEQKLAGLKGKLDPEERVLE